MDFASHALHVALREQMAQEIKNQEYRALLYHGTSGDRFPSGPKDFKAKQHFPQDFRFRNALRRKPSLTQRVTLPRPSSGSRKTTEDPSLVPSTRRVATSPPPGRRSPRKPARPRIPSRRAGQKEVSPRSCADEGAPPNACGGAGGAVLRCRLLGHAEPAAVAVSGWQATFEYELTNHLTQLLGKRPDLLHVRARKTARSHQVSVHISMSAMEKDAQQLQQSLWDGQLRRLALRNCTGLDSPWPTSQALRQFLLREVACEVFWVVERHEWRIENFQQALSQRPYAMMTSESFDLGGGTNLTLHLHPAGGPGGPPLHSRGASLTLSAAGHGLPSSPFLLSAGTHGEIWVGPFGRDASNRFVPGGSLCSSDELRKLHANRLVLAAEAVQSDPPECAREPRPELEAPQAPLAPEPSPPQAVGSGEAPGVVASAPVVQRQESPISLPTGEVDSAQLLRAVTEAAQGVQVMAASLAQKPWTELVELVQATHQQVQDLAQQMAALQRAVGANASPSQSPARKGFRHKKIDAALELDNQQLLWKVSLHDEEDPLASTELLTRGTLVGTASGSTLDFQEEPANCA